MATPISPSTVACRDSPPLSVRNRSLPRALSKGSASTEPIGTPPWSTAVWPSPRAVKKVKRAKKTVKTPARALPRTPRPGSSARLPDLLPEPLESLHRTFGQDVPVRAQQHGDPQSVLGDEGVVGLDVDDFHLDPGPAGGP